VVTSLACFGFQVPRTLARVHTPKHAWMFTPAMGVDVALNQADVLAHLIAEEMSLGEILCPLAACWSRSSCGVCLVCIA
jgi:trk system potassium uptake protein TrkA